MRIDPKYFNSFMIVVAIAAAAIIVWGTFRYRSNLERAFQHRVARSDTLAGYRLHRFSRDDSLAIRDYRGEYVLLDFWAEWSDPSLASHRHLDQFARQYSDTLRVLAASVREDSETVVAYRNRLRYSFEYVDGTELYNRLEVPGIPSQLLFDPDGALLGAFTGYTDSTRYDSLEKFMPHE